MIRSVHYSSCISLETLFDWLFFEDNRDPYRKIDLWVYRPNIFPTRVWVYIEKLKGSGHYFSLEIQDNMPLHILQIIFSNINYASALISTLVSPDKAFLMPILSVLRTSRVHTVGPAYRLAVLPDFLDRSLKSSYSRICPEK